MDIRVAAYGVIVRDGSILLAHWHWPEGGVSRWTLPGGGLEFGEHPEETAAREILEETGYTAEIGALLGIDSIVIPGDQRISNPGVPQQGLRVVYAATVVSGDLTIELDGSTDDARWFPLHEVAALDTVELVDIALDLWRATQPE